MDSKGFARDLFAILYQAGCITPEQFIEAYDRIERLDPQQRVGIIGRELYEALVIGAEQAKRPGQN